MVRMLVLTSLQGRTEPFPIDDWMQMLLVVAE